MTLPTTHIRTAPPRAAEDRRLKLIGLLVIAGSFGALCIAVNGLSDKWSLGLLYVFPFVVLTVISSNLFAAGMILVAVGCGSGRTLRDPRRRRAVILQVLLANALVPAGLAGALMDDKSLQAHFADSGWDIALAVAAYVFCFIAWRLWRRSRQHDSLSADEAMALDPRPPVLYLRSFQDDGVSMFAEASTPARRLLKALSLPTSEEYTATILARIGPLIAIGKPDEPLPELGAARLYVAHDQWQRKVTELMQRAALVVVRVGASPGVLWEIEQALSMLPRQRLVLTVLGGTAVAPELVTRLTPVLGTTLAAVWPEPHLGWRTLLSLRTSRRIGGLVCFNADGKASAVPVQMGIAGSNQWSWLRMNFFMHHWNWPGKTSSFDRG